MDRDEMIAALQSRSSGVDASIPDEILNAIYEYECGPQTTDLAELQKRGYVVPAPHEFATPDHMSAKLAEIIHALADMKVYLMFTSHLSDQQLYEKLWEVMQEPHGSNGPDTDCIAFTTVDCIGFNEDRESIIDHYYPEGELWGRDAILPKPDCMEP